MTVVESVGSFTMPPLTGTLDGLWEVILDLADNLPPMSWALIGGQMVMAHGLAAGRTPPAPHKTSTSWATSPPPPQHCAQ